MKVTVNIVALIVLFLVLPSCSSDKESAGDGKETELAARVDDWEFTRDQLQTVIDNLSEVDKLKYDTPGGRAELADKMIEEELYYREGMKMGLDETEFVKKSVADYTRMLVVQEYFTKNIQPLTEPTEEEMIEYYNDNPDRFTRQPIVRAYHIFSRSEEKLLELKERYEKGEKFTELARKYSEDVMTREDGGDLGYFNPGGYIRGVGYSDVISDVCFSMKAGQVSEPVKWKKGWSLIAVTEVRPEVLSPLDEVRDEIRQVFLAQRLDEVKKIAVAKLSKGYEVDNFLAADLKLKTRTPEELWNLAQNSSDSFERLRNYNEIVEKFPDSKYAAQAMFMVGFVNAEELKDFVAADRAFTRVLNEFPDSEVAESAKYMLETMNKPDPEFADPNESGEGDTESSDSDG